MIEIINYLKARYLSEKAQGMVEYALIVALVVGIAIIAFKSGLGNSVTKAFTHASTAIDSAANGQ
ncbi:Flp family type IVb pilin [Selenomonas bovis]|uniref:Flp family type IVb pilin n=1 Tax=Selenomonas bovis TaxID=416586 RepID=UPI0004E12499|nr:pilin protein [Selenomonas bovis]MCI6752462.1 pilin protein [Selenomonas bovis]MCI7057006.1 pilin protein [Selenomonas bovis]